MFLVLAVILVAMIQDCKNLVVLLASRSSKISLRQMGKYHGRSHIGSFYGE